MVWVSPMNMVPKFQVKVWPLIVVGVGTAEPLT